MLGLSGWYLLFVWPSKASFRVIVFSLSFIFFSFHAELRVFYWELPWQLFSPLDIAACTAIPGNGVTSSLSANNFLPFAVWICSRSQRHPFVCSLCLQFRHHFPISIHSYYLRDPPLSLSLPTYLTIVFSSLWHSCGSRGTLRDVSDKAVGL